MFISLTSDLRLTRVAHANERVSLGRHHDLYDESGRAARVARAPPLRCREREALSCDPVKLSRK
jgi:hypothetical protein